MAVPLSGRRTSFLEKALKKNGYIEGNGSKSNTVSSLGGIRVSKLKKLRKEKNESQRKSIDLFDLNKLSQADEIRGRDDFPGYRTTKNFFAPNKSQEIMMETGRTSVSSQ